MISPVSSPLTSLVAYPTHLPRLPDPTCLASPAEASPSGTKELLCGKANAPAPLRIPLFWTLPLTLTSCAPEGEIRKFGCQDSAIEIQSELDDETTSLLIDVLVEDFNYMTAITQEWLCPITLITLSTRTDNENHGAWYDSETGELELNLSGDWAAALRNPDAADETYQHNRAILRDALYHEIGHMVAEEFASTAEWQEFGRISWEQKDSTCETEFIGLTMEQCWALKAGAELEDFLGGGTLGEGLPYGASSLAEDWAEAFSVVLPYLLSTHSSFNFGISYLVDDYADSYSSRALDKWIIMNTFILDQADITG